VFDPTSKLPQQPATTSSYPTIKPTRAPAPDPKPHEQYTAASPSNAPTLKPTPAPTTGATWSPVSNNNASDWSGVLSTSIDAQSAGNCGYYSMVHQVESDAIRLGYWTPNTHLSAYELWTCSQTDAWGSMGYFMKQYGLANGTFYNWNGTTTGYGTTDQYGCQGWKTAPKYKEMNYDGSGALYGEPVMQQYILNVGPLAIAVDSSCLASYSSGIISASSCTSNIDHAAQLTGVDLNLGYFKLRNQWGNWGEGGYARLQTIAGRSVNTAGISSGGGSYTFPAPATGTSAPSYAPSANPSSASPSWQSGAYTATISSYAGTLSTSGTTGDGGAATSALLNKPYGVAVDGSSNVFVVDYGNNNVRLVTSSTGIISTYAGSNAATAGSTGDSGAATSAYLNAPQYVAVDNSNNVYISDSSNYRVRMVSRSTGIITTIVGTGVAGTSGGGTVGTSTALAMPTGLVFDSSNNLYIADARANRIFYYNAGTTLLTLFAGNTAQWDGCSWDGQSKTSATFSSVFGLALDNSNNLYVSDYTNNNVRVISATTGIVTTYAGDGCVDGAVNSGNAGSTGDGSWAINARFYAPRQIAMDANKNLYIADASNSAIRVVNSAGIVSTYVGQVSFSGSSGNGGAATSAMLSSPYGVAVRPAGGWGALYVADTSNRAVRAVSVAFAVPTAKPTTSVPTGKPFAVPSPAPTPTWNHLLVPTVAPTPAPSNPTMAPNGLSPTAKPSKNPSVRPSPKSNPTYEPTKTPAGVPTVAPTLKPSGRLALYGLLHILLLSAHRAYAWS